MTQDARDQERKQAPQSVPQEGQKIEESGTGEQEDASHEKLSNGSVSHGDISNEDLASVFLRETEVV
ncbi:MAG: CDP-diacylglycerol--serine O-phosphatidyltransferase, partial [Halomonas venusta]|nr:CDP-diacylglycerol--serine O-phosphatidyltransferase [Halomonas venusta]